jgi:hypothetical protein
MVEAAARVSLGLVVYQLITLPPLPRSNGIKILARFSCQNLERMGVIGKIFKNKGLDCILVREDKALPIRIE